MQYSNDRKAKDISKKNTKRPFLTTLEPSDRVLIRNLSERRGTIKLRQYWEQQVHVFISSVDENLCCIIK